jgi:hypothetical protein
MAMAQGPYAPSKQTRMLWGIFFGVIVAAYTVAFVAVIVRAAGFGGASAQITPAPGTIVAGGASSPADATATVLAARDIATPAPTATPTPRPPTPTPPPPQPTATPTPNPDVDFRVPLSASNTGSIHGYEVAILGITDDTTGTGARPKAGNKYVAVEVSIANQTPNAMPQGAWTLRTNVGQEYDISRSVVVGTPLPSAPLQGNARVTGFVVFEVPQAAKVASIRFHAPQFPKGDLFFDA